MDKGTTIACSLFTGGVSRQWWQQVPRGTGLFWTGKSTWTNSSWLRQSTWSFWTYMCGLTAVGENIAPQITLNAMQGQHSQSCVGRPPLSVPMSSDVTSHEARDTHTGSGHIMSITHNKLFDWDGQVGKCLLWGLRMSGRKCHAQVENLGQNSISETCEDEIQCFPGWPGSAKTSGDQSLTAWVVHAWDPSYSLCWAWQIACTQLWAAVRGDDQMSIGHLASLQRSQSHLPA